MLCDENKRTSGDITIKLPDFIKWTRWKILNIRGEMVKSGIIDDVFSQSYKLLPSDRTSIKLSEHKLRLIGLESGIYFSRVSSKKGRIGVGKFVVE